MEIVTPTFEDLMEILDVLERTRSSLSAADAFLTLIEIASAGSENISGSMNNDQMARAKGAGVLPIIDRAAKVLRAMPRAIQFKEMTAALDQSIDPALDGIWMRESAARQIVHMIRGSSSVRFSFSATFRPCLSYAVETAERGGNTRLVYLTPNAEEARLMSSLVRLLDLSEYIKVEEGWAWHHQDQKSAEIEVMFPPFGLDLREDLTIPAPVLASIGIMDGKIGRLTAENVTLAYALECVQGRAIVATTDGEMFRMVGIEPIIRRNLIDSGRLRAVMGIPAGLAFSNTSIRTNLVLLSDRSADEIRDVVWFADLGHDAVAVRGRRGRLEVREGVRWSDILTQSSITDAGLARDVPRAEIVANNFVLLTDRYLNTGPRDRIDQLLAKSEVVHLEDVAELIRPMSLSRDDVGDYTLRESAPSDISERGFLNEPSRTVQVDRAKYVKGYNQQLRSGDLVLAVKGSVGVIGLVPEHVPGDGKSEIWTVGQSMMILRPKKRSGISPLALYEYLSNDTVQAFVRSLAGGAAIQSLSIKDIKNIPIPVPNPETVDRIEAAFVERMAIFDKIDGLKKQLEEVRSTEWPHRLL